MSSALNRIDKHKFAPEIPLVRRLAEEFTLDQATRRSIVEQAAELVRRVRTSPKGPTMLDAFLNEFGLHNDEGVALMCLAESLLRVPDPQTADELIADKLGPAHWDEHLGHSSSLLVNASTWALMLTGRAVSMRRFEGQSGGAVLQSLAGRLGEPVIRGAVRQAMSILGQEFVMGETMEEAIKRAYRLDGSVEYSFDILGEGARTAQVADEYFEAYCKAIPMVGERQPDKPARRCGMSIKLTALHPRYEARQSARVHEEMYPRLLKLCELGREHDIPLCLDAEEADRLILSLELTERLCGEPSLRGWNGLGLAVQGYGKRARRVIQWLSELAQATRRQISVRLVKGAYWDAEIKRAQIAGMPDYPVFTAKDNTDTSYLSCAQAMLAERPHLFCAFATHNAHTLTTVLTLAEDRLNMEPAAHPRHGRAPARDGARNVRRLPAGSRLCAGRPLRRPAGLPGAAPAGERRQLQFRQPALRRGNSGPRPSCPTRSRYRWPEPLPPCPPPNCCTERNAPTRPAATWLRKPRWDVFRRSFRNGPICRNRKPWTRLPGKSAPWSRARRRLSRPGTRSAEGDAPTF